MFDFCMTSLSPILSHSLLLTSSLYPPQTLEIRERYLGFVLSSWEVISKPSFFQKNKNIFATHGTLARFFQEVTSDVDQAVYVKGHSRSKAGHAREQRAGYRISMRPTSGKGWRWHQMPMVSSVPACVMMLSGHSSSADLLVGSNLYIIMNVSHLVLTLLGERTEEVLHWRYPSIWLCLSLPWAVSGGSCPLAGCNCDDQHHTFLCSMICSCKLWKLGDCSEVF